MLNGLINLDYEINSSDLLEDIVTLQCIGNMIFRYKLLWPLIRFIGLCYCDKAYPALSQVILSTPSSEAKRSVEYIMAEVMICRGGAVPRDENIGKEKVFTEAMYDKSTNFIVPENVVNNEIRVILMGGGGAAGDKSGGGSGWINIDTFKLSSNEVIPITIGLGGSDAGADGGATSFGTYMYTNGGEGGMVGYASSNGGNGGAGGAGNGKGGRGYQFGGGAGANYGGEGGPWGGGGGGGKWSMQYWWFKGGDGGIYGGGGGGCYGGNGGKYGGGGASYTRGNESDNSNIKTNYGGWGGEFGGNGGVGKNSNKGYDNQQAAENGTNTIGWTNVTINPISNEYLTGPGTTEVLLSTMNNTLYNQAINNGQNAYYFCSGGGGFGGCGGGGGYTWNATASGGGGGYGGNGGDRSSASGHGGGGGGYGGDGSNGGGGGGYFGNAGITMNSWCYTGGGGYLSDSISVMDASGNNVYTGGAGYFYNGQYYGYGGTANNGSSQSGYDGVCILQFYRWL